MLRESQNPLLFLSLLLTTVLVVGAAGAGTAQTIEQSEAVASAGEDGTAANVEAAKSGTFTEAESLDADDVDAVIRSKETKTAATFTELETAIVAEKLLVGGLDHLAAGTGTRNAGYGTIRLRGAPPGARLVAAFLYWGDIVAGPAPLAANVNFEGRRVTGRLIGSTTQPCWNGGGVFALYRAVVSHLVPREIDGDYQVDGFASNLVDGRDPWASVNNTLPLAEGASLVVLFTERNIPRSARLYFTHGPVFFFGQVDIVQGLFPGLPAHAQLKLTRIGADGQGGFGLRAVTPISDERTFVGPAVPALTQIRGTGSTLHTDSDWNGDDGGPLNQLWDTHTDDITGTVGAAAPSYVVRYRSFGDCIEAAVHILGAL